MNAVDGFRWTVLRKGIVVSLEETHKGNAMGLRNLLHGRSVEPQTAVVLLSVRKVGVLQVLVGEWGEEDQPGGRLAVVLLGESVLNELGEVVLEPRQPRLAGEGLVVPEEGE